jgi:hypothetical protein
MDKNDLEALRAAFRGVKSTYASLQGREPMVEGLASAAADAPPTELIHAATAHAIAAAALSGLLHRLYTPGGVAPTSMELTDSAGESGS